MRQVYKNQDDGIDTIDQYMTNSSPFESLCTMSSLAPSQNPHFVKKHARLNNDIKDFGKDRISCSECVSEITNIVEETSLPNSEPAQLTIITLPENVSMKEFEESDVEMS